VRLVLSFAFWFLYFPLLRLLSLLLFWNRKLEEREWFEKKNKFEALAHSFRERNLTADLCFEFSSEGEYQQVAPLIEDALKEGKRLELVFFSPSVEKAIMQLASRYPEQIRYLRYPLVRFFPFVRWRSFTHWATAKRLIMVRYDLFPEFLLWGLKKENELVLLWFTFKKERTLGKAPSLWKRLFLKASGLVVYAGEKDSKIGEELKVRGATFDFRIEQIRRRVLKRDEKLRQAFAPYPALRERVRKEKSLILGNSWPSDLVLLEKLAPEVNLVIVPHRLNEETIESMRQGLEKLGREVSVVNELTRELPQGRTLLINMKGILCELYSDFSHAYVGGGLEGSIHSVLEPIVAGSRLVSCGPRHHRSTEYDFGMDLGVITEVKTPEQFELWLNSDSRNQDRASIDLFAKDYEALKMKVLSC
jgi:3-deoxy-D-manno-octulosonic-acid transferase